jgi:peptide/nickel transport system ATP-binding protein
VAGLSGRDRRAADLAIQMVFQDPMGSLNPRKRVVDIIGEAPVVHGLVPASGMEAYVCETMARVGLDPSPASATRTSSPAASGPASASRGRSP